MKNVDEASLLTVKMLVESNKNIYLAYLSYNENIFEIKQKYAVNNINNNKKRRDISLLLHIIFTITK